MQECTECARDLTGHEEEICMDCANTKMVQDPNYTRNTVNNLKQMGYTRKEIMEAIAQDKHIKIGEIRI